MLFRSLCYDLFNIMQPQFPLEELKLIDMTLRMFTHPQLYIDEETLMQRLDDLRAEKSELLGSLKEKLACETEEEVRKKLDKWFKYREYLEVEFDLDTMTAKVKEQK